MADKQHRINNYYKIVDKDTNLVTFKLNRAQAHFLANRGSRNIICKSRQLGFTTFAAVDSADDVFFNPNIYALILSYDKDSSQTIFEKVMLAWEHFKIPGYDLKKLYTVDNESANRLKLGFGDGTYSSILVKTSGRGTTTNKLHISEFAKICAKYPKKAQEVLSGTIQSVPPSGEVTIESTAEGNSGLYYDMFWTAWNRPAGQKIKPTEFKAFFYNWQWDDRELNRIKDEEIETEFPKEFLKIQEDHNIKVIQHPSRYEYMDDRQLTHYYHLWLGMNKNWELLKQEYPIYVEEAFVGSGAALFDRVIAQQMKDNAINPIKILNNDWKIYEDAKPGHTYIAGCLPDGEKVLTEKGLKDIEKVTIQDKLIDKDGKNVDIVNLQRRYYEGNIYEISPYYTSYTTKFTPEHPLLVLKDNNIHRKTKKNGGARYYNIKDLIWKNTEDIKKGDIVKIPIRFKEILKEKEILLHAPSQSKARIDRKIKKDCLLKEDFWFFIGLWLAEGWVRKDKKGHNSIALHLNGYLERDLAEKVKKMVKELFNRKLNIVDKVNVLDLKFSSEFVYQFIIDNFGQKAKHKDIKEWIKFLPNNLKKSLFEGYMIGDGCITNVKKENKDVIECVSISDKLLFDFQEILLSLNIISAVHLLRDAGERIIKKGKVSKTQKTYTLRISSRETAKLLNIDVKFKRKRHCAYGWIEDNNFFVKINKINKKSYKGFVNNFETKTHTYQSPFLVTHNCDPAEGVKRDHSAIVILDMTPSLKHPKVVATYASKFIAPDELAYEIKFAGEMYYFPLVAVERNNSGHATLAILKRNYPEDKIYKEVKDDKFDITETERLGWLTTGNSKPKMFYELKALVNLGSLNCPSEIICHEILTYDKSLLGSTKFDPDATNHFDLLTALAIAYQMKTNIEEDLGEVKTHSPKSDSKENIYRGI